MSMSWTYATLTDAILQWVDGDTSSTTGLAATANMASVVQAAEEQILKDLQLVIWDGSAAINLVQDSPLVTKPSGYVAWRSANYVNAQGKYTPLELRTLEYIEDYCPDPTATGAPKYLAEYSETAWKVGPTPSANRTGKALYVKRPTSLVTNTSGTWISEKLGLMLFRAGIWHASLFIKNSEQAKEAQALYQQALSTAAHEFRNLIRPGYTPIVSTPRAREEP